MEVSLAGRRALSHDSAGTPGELFAVLGIELRVGCTVREGALYGRQWLLRVADRRSVRSACELYSPPYYAGLEREKREQTLRLTAGVARAGDDPGGRPVNP